MDNLATVKYLYHFKVQNPTQSIIQHNTTANSESFNSISWYRSPSNKHTEFSNEDNISAPELGRV